MEIRTAAGAETQACEAILRAAFGDYVRRLGRSQSSDAHAWLPMAISEQRVLIARDGQAIKGVAIVSDVQRVRIIEQIAVDPRFQRQGIGGALIDAIERSAIQAKALALELDTAEMMTHLMRLYSRHGFDVVRKGPPSHGRDTHLRVYMRKHLPRSA